MVKSIIMALNPDDFPPSFANATLELICDVQGTFGWYSIPASFGWCSIPAVLNYVILN